MAGPTAGDGLSDGESVGGAADRTRPPKRKDPRSLPELCDGWRKSGSGPTAPTSSTGWRRGLGPRPQVQGVLAVKEWRTAQYQLAGPVGHPGSLTSAESAYSQPAAPANAGYLVARVRRVVWRVGMGT